MIDISALNVLKTKYEGDPRYAAIMKYFDFTVQYQNKAEIARVLGLETGSLDILDFATGPGYFPMICKALGHRVDCADIPLGYSGSKSGFEYVYEEIHEVLGVKKSFDILIEPLKPIPDLGRQYDLITGFYLNCFHGWEMTQWDYFIADMKKYLKPGKQTRIALLMNVGPSFDSIERWAPDLIRNEVVEIERCPHPNFSTMFIFRIEK